MTTLQKQSCRPCEGKSQALTHAQARDLMPQIPGWTLDESASLLHRTFTFHNFYETMAFVNAVAYIAHTEDHHPDLTIGYKECRISYQTHALSGLSENDFICAAKIDALDRS